ncbi:MAG: gamma-glutamyl-gamma-aminobutyrate hydrolase family protein [Clostridia bacterium]|nr:gamma-glutamyl-gamma-aminobutyrate hydrolase family protein [Clostridia bacterium]
MTNDITRATESTRKPLIGIVPGLDESAMHLNMTYVNAISLSGGIPISICPTASEIDLEVIASQLDGFLFTGGIDVFPEFYGDNFCHEKTEYCKARDLFELTVFKIFYKTKKPIMGICRGVQLVNVALGGTLFQHIENHSGVTHSVKISGRLVDIAESIGLDPATVQTNSYHHQALKNLGKGLEIIALSEENIIEAVCDFSDGRYLLGVQFHPEKSFNDDEYSRAIIKDFVLACQG